MRNSIRIAAFVAAGVRPLKAHSVHIRENQYQVAATEDLSVAQYKLITLAGTVCQAADKGRVAGICKFKATSGQNASAVYEGVTKGLCGAAVSTPGWPLKSANSGWLTPCNSGDQMVARYAGASTTASGDLIPVFIDVTNLGFWGG